MCGRIVSSTPVSALAEQFVVAEVRAAEAAARYNVAPTHDVLAVATTAGAAGWAPCRGAWCPAGRTARGRGGAW